MTDHSALIERLDLIVAELEGLPHVKQTVAEAADALRNLTAGDTVVVPIEPTNAMLQGACKSHTPGMSMGADRFGRVSGECPSFDRRRRIWADMISTYRSSTAGYEAAGEVSPNLKAKAQGEGG